MGPRGSRPCFSHVMRFAAMQAKQYEFNSNFGLYNYPNDLWITSLAGML